MKPAALLLLALSWPAFAAPTPAAKPVVSGLFGLTVWGDFDEAVTMARTGGFRAAVISGNAEHLDALRKAGMRGIVGLWLDKETAEDPKKWAAFRARVTKTVRELKDRPALLAWYLADEPDGERVPLDKIAEARGLIRALDKKTPLLAVFDEPERWAGYFPYFDIICVDPYLRRTAMGGYEDTAVVSRWLEKAKADLKGAQSPKQLWAVLGAFDERPNDAAKPPDYKKPTPEEFRLMADLARGAGVDGILVYSFSFTAGGENRGWRLAEDDPPLWRAVQESAGGRAAHGK